MPCCGQHKTMDGKPAPKWDAHDVMATEACLFCGDKHLATAYALSLETGYTVKNRARINGELVLAQWHTWQTSLPLAEAMAAARHQIQRRQELSVDWNPLLQSMENLILAELKRNPERT